MTMLVQVGVSTTRDIQRPPLQQADSGESHGKPERLAATTTEHFTAAVSAFPRQSDFVEAKVHGAMLLSAMIRRMVGGEGTAPGSFVDVYI